MGRAGGNSSYASLSLPLLFTGSLVNSSQEDRR